MKHTIFAVWFAVIASAQTTVYLRSSAPASVSVVSVTGGTPATIVTKTAHNLAVGDLVIIGGVCTDSGASAANGVRKVKATLLPTSFSITDLSGVDITTSNSINCDLIGAGPGAMWAGKATAHTLGPGPLGYLDGLNGTMYRKLSLGTQNGLFQNGGNGGIVVSGNAATVTTTYNHGLTSGDKISIWNATNAALNTGNPVTGAATAYMVTVTDPTHFTFPTSGVANGDYTSNLRCGPSPTPNDLRGGTENCVRISQLAYTGNAFWDAIVANTAALGFNSGTGWKSWFDGGSINFPQSEWASNYDNAAVRFLVDQLSDQMLSISVYCLTRLTIAGGGNWFVNQSFNDAGNVQINQNSGGLMAGIAWAYYAAGAYLSPAHLTTLRGQIYNDVDDPSVAAASTADADMSQPGHREVVAGPAAAQGGSSNTIILNAADAHPDNFCVNSVVATTVSGTPYFGIVTGYVASSKVATVSGWVNFQGSPGQPPVAGTVYSIYATITIASAAAGATTTVTGYNTHFTTMLQAGDSIIGTNYWSIDPFQSLSYVKAVIDDTHATVINSNAVLASSTPSITWYAPQWKTGDVGLLWAGKHWQGTSGAQPMLYPPNGGTATENRAIGEPTEGANNGGIYYTGAMAVDFAMAPLDPRAVRDLAIQQSFAFDYAIRHYMNYSTGTWHSGGFYNYATSSFYTHLGAAMLQNSVATFPNLDMSGPWVNNYPLYKMFAVYPDFHWNGSQHVAWPLRIGAQSGANNVKDSAAVRTSFVVDPIFAFNPGSTTAKLMRDWLQHSPATVDLWSSQGTYSTYFPLALLWNDPRIGTVSYTSQPHQYLFGTSSAARCAAVTGWPCPTTFQGNAVVSRTGFSSLTDTMLYFDSRAYWSDHDIPQQGALRVYKVGELLWADGAPPSNPTDGTHVGVSQDNQIQFSNGDFIKSGDTTGAAAVARIIRWGSAKAGSWGNAYGDDASNYMYVCSDLSGVYTISLDYAQRCVAHLKKPGTEEIIIQWDSVKPLSSTQISTHVQYEQTGEASVSAYPEGTTRCPGVGGCGSLNTSRWVQSMEDGGGPDNDPKRQYGIISKYLSPGTIAVVWDDSTFSDSQGHTDRVSVCGGNSCSDSVSTFESLIVHKVAQNLSDTTLVSTALNPDSNWTGVQTADKVVLMARGGVTHNSVPAFATTHSGSAQYLFGGLAAGNYAVTVNGTPVPGSPFAVADGDNSIEFESISGTVSVSGGGAAPSGQSSVVFGNVGAKGSVIIH